MANRVTKALAQVGIKAEAIHDNKSQAARERALKNFKTKKIDVLVATDIAARGTDIDELLHVINYTYQKFQKPIFTELVETEDLVFHVWLITFVATKKQGS